MPRRRKKRAAAKRDARPRRDYTTLLHLTILAGASFLLYYRTLANGFVSDDEFEVLGDRFIRSFATLPHLFVASVWFFAGPGPDNYYRPLKLAAYSAEYHLFGFHPSAWHLANLVFHVGAVFAAYLLVRALGSRAVAFWSALIFAAHPIHVEAVAWIAAGNDLLCGLALLLATWLYHRARTEARPYVSHALALALFLAALLFKETALAFPLVILAYDFFYRGESLREMARSGARYAGYFALLGGYLAVRFHALGGFAPTSNTELHLGVKGMALSVPVLVAHYVEKVLLPIHLNFYYVFTPTTALGAKALGGFALTAGLVASVFLLRRRRPLLAFALAWFLLTLVPVLDIPKLGNSVFTERYLYIPSFGFCVFAGWGWEWLRERARRPAARAGAYAALVALLAFYAGVILRRIPDWHDDLRLYTKTVRQSPNAADILGQLGAVYSRQGRHDEALGYFERAAKIDPGRATVHNNLGNALMELGRDDEAIAELKRATTMMPGYATFWRNLGEAYARKKQWPGAIEAYRKGLALDASDYALWTELGLALWSSGQREQALAAYRRAIGLEPERIEARVNLANGLALEGQLDAAAAEFARALEGNPDAPQAYLVHYDLGAIYQQKGMLEEAAQEYERALELNGSFVPARIRLEALRARQAR
jgi:protein O-mannosyl-transferase